MKERAFSEERREGGRREAGGSSCIQRMGFAARHLGLPPASLTHLPPSPSPPLQSLDMKYCDDDATWRKRVLAVYNKSEADFSTLVAYNDYLEEVEDIVFCIVNDDPSAGGLIEKVKEVRSDEERKTAREKR